ncbi:MAG TPA: M20/M25/M40 family metallo-hydrolase [Thermoanaerobaculia bacterium]|jgi:acetylornithine deacetylase/succinyl-diaminopimelate desuccinylase-like protein|nr:M20/M25/M40 family metallo-hydrolase [Thermoanaerobaculia bacterium]
MKRLAILLLFIAAAAQAAEPAQRAILTEFSDFLAIPNLASDAPNIVRNASAIQAMFEKRGVKTRLLTLVNAPPIVVVDVPSRGATRTIAFYAHYDGQPVDPKQWQAPPWTPVMRDAAGNDVDWRNAKTLDPEWRLYARSSGDDKAPIIAMAAALDALRAAGRTPNVNLRFVFEGEEEAGSPHLGEYLAKYPAVLRPDAWILCDGPVHQSRRMQLVFGARGVVDAELTVYGPVKGLHDGHYGNWVPNPIIRLTHLIDSMRDESGRILIAHFYDDVKPSSSAEQDAIAKMPPVEADLKREFGIAATESENLNESLMRPALNVRGIQSGHIGALASNTIQTEATASIDFRLVPAETPDSIKKLVEQHIESQGYTIVRSTPDSATRLAHPKIAKLTWGAGYPPARTPLDLPLSQQIAALMTTAGHPPIRVPTLGGSIPMYLFQQPSNTPVLILPIANHDDNQHAANENIRLQNLWDGIDVYVALYEGLR